MSRKQSPVWLILVGLAAVTAMTAAWLRNTAAEIAGKPVNSDRALKTEINPVRW